MYIDKLTKYIRKHRMVLSISVISVLLLFTVRNLYRFSARDYHVKHENLRAYSPLDRAVQVASYLTNLEIQKLQKEQDRIDFKYCGGPCRFINALYVREQETRAQLHVRHLAFTAGMVNRTLVLPNVSGSHIGACLSHNFEYYYDIQWASRNSDNFNFIRMNDFIAWIKERKRFNVPVSDQVLSTLDLESPVTTLAPVSHCFSNYTRQKSTFNQILRWNITGQTDKKAVKAREALMVQFLRRDEDTEVLHLEIHKANQWSQMVQSDIPIPYNPALVHFADTTAKSLGPYIAVHWRMEASVNTSNMLPCAKHLVSLLKRHKNKYKVFLLTDYPHMFTLEQQHNASIQQTSKDNDTWLQSNSDSFLATDFTKDHHLAIQYLYQHGTFHLLETTKETGVTPEHWRLMRIPQHLKSDHKMIDSGLLGILDKLMAMRSVHFFAGQKGDVCGRSRSTFTAQIINERTLLRKSRTNYFGPSL